MFVTWHHAMTWYRTMPWQTCLTSFFQTVLPRTMSRTNLWAWARQMVEKVSRKGNRLSTNSGHPQNFISASLSIVLQRSKSEYLQVSKNQTTMEVQKICWCFSASPDLSTEHRPGCLMTRPSFLLLFSTKTIFSKILLNTAPGLLFLYIVFVQDKICTGKSWIA